MLVTFFTLLGFMLRGGSAEHARAIARREVGPGYKFVVSSLNTYSSFGGKMVVSAAVIAYNPREIKKVQVSWERDSGALIGWSIHASTSFP
jgi:hypothetical protein